MGKKDPASKYRKAVAPATDEVLTARVTDLSSGGAGIARDEGGRVIFVPFSAPGDLLKVRITGLEKRYAQAEILEIIEPSPVRQTPPCTVFGKCGGCQWQHLPYRLQWETKVKGIRHTLQRRQLVAPEPIVELPAERIWEYRNRVQLRGVPAPENRLGFHERGSNRLVPIDRCEIARPEINAVLAATRAEGSRLPRPYKVEIEALPDGEIRHAWNSPHAALGFRQIHDEQNAKMRQWIRDTLPPERVVFDLFGGSGNFSLHLSDRMKEVHCVDVSAPGRTPPGTPANVRFHRSAVAPWLQRMIAPDPGTAVAILDPPREGLGADFNDIESALRKAGVNELVAVGCDANSWAHDLSRYLRRGWRLQQVAIVDLFPQTPHVEGIAHLLL